MLPVTPQRRIDLQLFAQEKTEQATPRRRQEARRKGQVFQSQELSSALLLLTAFTTLYLATPYMLGQFRRLVTWVFTLDPSIVSASSIFTNVYLPLLGFFAQLTFPMVGAILVVGLVANFSQVGFILSAEPLRFRPERLNPVEGFKRIFSRRALVQLVKSLAKLVIVLLTSYLLLRQFLNPISLLSLMELEEGIRAVGNLAVRLGVTSSGVLLILGILDLFYQRWEYEKSLMMSKQEVKDELKQLEGDPQVRARIRQLQRQIATRRMMAEVPRADVVITNPVHYAVALKYDPAVMSAPRVVAKGKGFLAQRIKEIAREYEIILVENPPLAQGLYWAVEVGEEIPAEFYQAVAEVLAFIYRLRNRV